MRTYQLLQKTLLNGRYDPRHRVFAKLSPAMCCDDFIIFIQNHYLGRSGQLTSINRTYLNTLDIGENNILQDWEIYVSYIPGKLQTNTLSNGNSNSNSNSNGNSNGNVYYQKYIIYHR